MGDDTTEAPTTEQQIEAIATQVQCLTTLADALAFEVESNRKALELIRQHMGDVTGMMRAWLDYDGAKGMMLTLREKPRHVFAAAENTGLAVLYGAVDEGEGETTVTLTGLDSPLCGLRGRRFTAATTQEAIDAADVVVRAEVERIAAEQVE